MNSRLARRAVKNVMFWRVNTIGLVLNLIFFFCSESYLREIAAHLPGGLSGLHAAGGSAAAAIHAANAAAAIAASSAAAAAATNVPEVGAHKRPRLVDLGGHSSSVSGPAPGSSGSNPATGSISQPLRIDTREAVKVGRCINKVKVARL